MAIETNLPSRPSTSANRTSTVLAVLCAGILAVLAGSCARHAETTTSDVRAARVPTLPAGPEDPAWEAAPVCAVDLIPQDMVEPRQLHPTTGRIRVQALTDGSRIAFRLAWEDSSRDELPAASRFGDACAVQFPAAAAADLPAPQMGEAGRRVEITYWSANWQAVVDGRPADDIRALYPGAEVGHYPFEAQSLAAGSPEQEAMRLRYAPARALGNTMSGDGKRAVQDLIAEGPGTLTAVAGGASDGRGVRSGTGWAVVVSRPISAPLASAGRSHAAFAVWDGGREEVGARKMRSVWVPVVLEEAGS